MREIGKLVSNHHQPVGEFMSLKERMEALKAKHAVLENQLHVEVQRPFPSSEMLSRLKREKLKIKDELARLGAEREPTIH